MKEYYPACDTCAEYFEFRPGFTLKKVCKVAEKEIPYTMGTFLYGVGCRSYRKKENK
jgi:hypothetical protein